MNGEAIVALISRNRRMMHLPAGIHRLPGPAFVIAQRFIDSPAGPFLCVSVGEPARVGARIGYFFGASAVDNPDVRRMARHLWGFVQELGHLTWTSDATSRSLVWEERGLSISAEIGRLRVPLIAPGRALQRRSDGPVIVPAKVSGFARRSRIELAIEEDDDLAPLIGVHGGWAIDGLAVKRHPARRPQGLLSRLRPPMTSPEPGVIGMNRMRRVAGQKLA